MNATIYNILMIVSFSLSGIFLVVAILLFFKLKIKAAIDELSGKKSRKQVAEIRKENAASQSRGYVPEIFRKRNDRITTSLASEPSRRLKKATAQLSREDVVPDIDDLVDEAGGTVVLNDSTYDSRAEEGTTVLGTNSDYEGTTLLTEEDEGTTLLTGESGKKDYEKKKCKVIKEIEVFEAKEFIEVED